MIVEISHGPGAATSELCICEFQGEVVGDLQGNELGSITISASGKAQIGIGLHQLEGQVIPLKLPFLVLEKQKPTQKRKRDSGKEEGDGDEDGTSSSAMTVLGIARKKIMFKSRPNPRA